VKELSLRIYKCTCLIIAPPASCRTWRPLLPPNNNAEGDEVPDQTISGKILMAEVSSNIICSLILNLKPFVDVRICNRP
jgi:hypothetical protein